MDIVKSNWRCFWFMDLIFGNCKWMCHSVNCHSRINYWNSSSFDQWNNPILLVSLNRKWNNCINISSNISCLSSLSSRFRYLGQISPSCYSYGSRHKWCCFLNSINYCLHLNCFNRKLCRNQCICNEFCRKSLHVVRYCFRWSRQLVFSSWSYIWRIFLCKFECCHRYSFDRSSIYFYKSLLESKLEVYQLFFLIF